jgi:hypothetical protein
MVVETVPCPACGGAGGGPLGRAGSAWDDESYVCPRCEGEGVVRLSPDVPRPGIVKAVDAVAEKRKATG